MVTRMVNTIEIGFQVFSEDGGEEFGAVRSVDRGRDPRIVVYVENAGDFVVLPQAIKAVHDQKVILNLKAVDPDLRAAIARAHQAER
jgi:hypothetical protein